MNQSTYYERKNLSAWPCQDVDVLYEKIAKVGSGTYGEVNKARLKADPSQFVALKKIKDQSETQGFPITAMREINLLQECDHPNIIRLLNVANSNIPDPDCKKKKKRGSTYLVFEYMEHELLGLVQTNHFSDPQVKCIMKQILEGLDYCHSLNIIHRDIKSANILMNNKGEVKIADFGLARKVAPSFSGKLTQRVVTRWYRAPELLLGCKKYTTQIDIWALGCVFAELLMGKTHALFPAQKTPDQFELICEKCGIPSQAEWPGHRDLPHWATMAPKKNYAKVLGSYMVKQNKNINPMALDLLDRMLTLNPDTRITTKQALEHPYFHTAPYPTLVEDMPRFEKECHADVLNLKRKARVNVKNNVNNESGTKIQLTKIPAPNQNLSQSNVTFYDPIIVPSYPQKNVNQYPVPVAAAAQVVEPQNYVENNMNGNYGMMSQNKTNMAQFNSLMNLNAINHMPQANDMNHFNNVSGYNNMNNLSNTIPKLTSMHSNNTYTSNSTLDTTITNLTNMSNMSSMNDISNLSNLSNVSNVSTMSNITQSSNNNPFSRQSSNNNNAYNQFLNQQNALNYYWQYYLPMMNPFQFQKFEPDFNTNPAFNPYMGNTTMPELIHPNNLNNIFATTAPNNKPEEVPKAAKASKAKAASKKPAKQANANKNAKLVNESLDEKKVLQTLDELDFDFLENYKASEENLNCKRVGGPGIQDLDELVKKRQVPNPFVGVE